MIARLALAEAGIEYEPVFVDIRAKMSQQTPDYVRLNPNMSVPTLVMSGRNLDDSRLIAEFAFGLTKTNLDTEIKYWLDLHYTFPIEDLTIGGFLARSRMARFLIPKKLAKTHRHLLAMAVAHPDLANAYRNRAAVFADRARTFDPERSVQLAQLRRHEAIGLLDQLNSQLAKNDTVIVSPTYGIADVVWTVFLARMAFVGMTDEIDKRPLLARYWSAVQARPSFVAADIWTRLYVVRLIGGMFGVGTTPQTKSPPSSIRDGNLFRGSQRLLRAACRRRFNGDRTDMLAHQHNRAGKPARSSLQAPRCTRNHSRRRIA